MIKVLVIDDEMFVRKGIVMETDWDALGCVVVAEASNGQEGIEAVHKYMPELIISDIRMPKMDGIAMLHQLREEGSAVEVIFLTAYSEFSYAREALKLLAFDYLLKPFEDGELEEAVLKVKKRIESKNGTSDPADQILPQISADKSSKSGYIQEALAYIAEHYGDSHMSVGVIAESLGLSEGHLSHLFKKETDYTVMSYITRYRMRAAIKLLENCRYKVYEVAEMVGYKDITYFSSTFKKIVGVSPSEYQCR
ncbi:MAG: response regulator [Lachnospiraceae bacterium]|nr:response regulator [Lachnospiraceae bacterium]